MWNPVKISFSNLFSHVDSVYDFNVGKCTVVFGENRTDKNLENNGSGKTTLFEAVCIALTNDSARNIKKEGFINRDSDFCTVDLTLENKVLKKTLRVYRKFSRGNKPVEVRLYENGELNTQIVSVADANKRIYDLLGICREDLLRYYIVSQDSRYNFFTASDTEKKEIMNRITSADMIKPLIAHIREEISHVGEELDTKSKECEKMCAKIEVLNYQKQQLIEQQKDTRHIDDLKDKIRLLKNSVISDEKVISSEKKNLADEEKKIAQYKLPDVSVIDEKRSLLREEISDIDDLISEANLMRKKLERELDNVVECPKCGAEFTVDSDYDVTPDEAKNMIKHIESSVVELQAKRNSKKNEVEKLSVKFEEYDKAVEEKNRMTKRKNCIAERISDLEFSVKQNKAKIKRMQDEIDECERDSSSGEAVVAIEKNIEQLKNEYNSKSGELAPIEERLRLLRFWDFNLGKSGFTTYLANKSIKIIEGMTNSFLKRFGVELSVLINGFKILKNGDVREKIEVFATDDGITFEQFMSKSGGERGRIVLAGIMAINHLINSSIFGGGLNLLMLDESLSGIDCQGTMGIIDTMDRMGVTVMMITQNIEDVSICRNTVCVVKENGVSRIIK